MSTIYAESRLGHFSVRWLGYELFWAHPDKTRGRQKINESQKNVAGRDAKKCRAQKIETSRNVAPKRRRRRGEMWCPKEGVKATRLACDLGS